MIDLEKLSKEHEALFPNATAESQFYKMEEEIGEYQKTRSRDAGIRELADIWIVCAGLYRWFPKTATSILHDFSDEIIDESYELWNIEVEVNRKWEVNKSRKWEWNGKTYKHIGKDGNE